MAHYDGYRIFMDERWTLDDLYVFPRAYEQVYFALDALTPSETQSDEARIVRAFQAFPWRGGYSAVNFFSQLKYATPTEQRPAVVAIQYASPGYMELLLFLEQAAKVAATVAGVAGSIGVCAGVYHKIVTDLTKRKLLRIEVEREKIALTRAELELIADYSSEMAEILQLGSADVIHTRTGRPLVSLKILMSVYRRVKKLADYQLNGKATLPQIDNVGHHKR
jgi:hypothetical protein